VRKYEATDHAAGHKSRLGTELVDVMGSRRKLALTVTLAGTWSRAVCSL